MTAQGVWTPRVRLSDLSLNAPILYSQLTLVENLNLPDTMLIEGDLGDIRPALDPGSGIVVADENGTRRFSGVVTNPVRNVDGTGSVAFDGDLIHLRRRIIWPTPAGTFSSGVGGQTSAYDVQTGPSEDRLLHYIDVNAGPSARSERRVPGLRIPSSLARGTSATTSARFGNLLDRVVQLANDANLRITIRQTYSSGVGHLDVTLTELQDLSSSARYGTPGFSGPGLLGDGSYSLQIPVGNVTLCAAGGNGTLRTLNTDSDATSIATWGRIESFLDQRQTTDSSEINQAMAEADVANAAQVQVSATIADSPNLRLGVDVPVGSLVTAVIDGVSLVERVTSITTVVGWNDGDPTVDVSATIGSADGITNLTVKQATSMFTRLSALEAAP